MSDIAEAGLMEAWRPLAEKALGGLPLATLDTVTADGFRLAPLHGPAEPVYSGRSAHGDWGVIQRVDEDEGAAAQATEDLSNGATGLALVFAGAPTGFGRGLVADTVDALDQALLGVHLDHCTVHLEAGARGIEVFALFSALARRRQTPPFCLHAGIDPLGAFAAHGEMAAWEAIVPRLVDAVVAARDEPGLATLLRADGRPIAEAGATPAQELAFALASAAAIARALDESGIGPDETLPLVQMALSADQDQFATIAKLRAARRLWRLVTDACGISAPLTLHVSTARRMLSWSDPQTNLLRLTVAAFAAGAGGADSVTVLPFDAAASRFARRLARNTQTLLLEEAHVAEIADPGAGAGAIEAYTDAIASAAWDLFRAHEAEGLPARIASGAVADAVLAAAEAAEAAIAAGDRPIIGVTHHPPARPSPIPDETPRLASTARRRAAAGGGFRDLLAAARDGATLADLAATAPAPGLTAPALGATRAAAPFEG